MRKTRTKKTFEWNAKNRVYSSTLMSKFIVNLYTNQSENNWKSILVAKYSRTTAISLLSNVNSNTARSHEISAMLFNKLTWTIKEEATEVTKMIFFLRIIENNRGVRAKFRLVLALNLGTSEYVHFLTRLKTTRITITITFKCKMLISVLFLSNSRFQNFNRSLAVLFL